MRNQANLTMSGYSHPDALSKQFFSDFSGCVWCCNVEDDNIRFHGHYGCYGGALGQGFGEHPRVPVVFFQSRYLMLQGIQAGCSQKSRLTHATAHYLAAAPRLMDKIF